MNWNILRNKTNFKKARNRLQESRIEEFVDSLLHNKVDKLISPNSDEYLFVDQEKGYYYIIEQNTFRISNHGCFTSLPITLKFGDKLKSKVRDAIEKERQALKKEMFRNEIEYLETLINLYK